ncbi:exodeoxyribonuclease V subunit gamma [Candidatus Gillettellia adelgis]
MFTVYHSNQLHRLKTIMSELIDNNPLPDPLQQEIIVVNNYGMAQWIQIQLAETCGISANIAFFFPEMFIWKIFTHVLPDVPKENVFNKDTMRWKLMWLLPELLTIPDFLPLQHYLVDDNEKHKIHQLVDRIANLFNQYLIYRPQWLESWEHGQCINDLSETARWQARLWRRFIQYICKLEKSEWPRTNLYNRFISVLDTKKHCPPHLPKRIFIFGISALPPVYLKTLQALGHHIDIHLMFTNPCRYYWSDIDNHPLLTQLKNKKKYTYRCIQEPHLFYDFNQTIILLDKKTQKLSNSLLDSWGKLGRDYLFLLSQLTEIEEVDAFVDIPDDNMLHTIQHDILECKDSAVLGITPEIFKSSVSKRRLAPKDRSFSLHLCYSALREIEVLHDQLLTMLSEDLELMLHDIIVMAVDINSYTPYIQAIFGNASSECYLPFSISDHKAHQEHIMLKAFLSLLNLPYSRFTSEEVLGLLEVPALAARFMINTEELQLLRYWVGESGVRWGLDDDNVRELDLPETGQNTWRFGITRMLLGYAMDSKAGCWRGILPYDESNGLAAELIGQLANLLADLSQWRKWLSETRSLKEWLPLCRQLLDTFFVQERDNEVVIKLIEEKWQKIINVGIAASYSHAISFSILRDDLISHLKNEPISRYVISGKINFCTLISMRSIPYKVVCLLGMNDGVYPRTPPRLRFDLLSEHPECGDRSRRDDDRYLFLETILSAQQHLYISYIGRSIQDNKKRYPSVLLTELLEYLKRSYYLPGDENLDVDSSGQRVGQHLLQWHTRMPFASENFLPDSKQQSYATIWLPVTHECNATSLPFIRPLYPKDEPSISLDDLRRFYYHPIRAFFQLRLGVSFKLNNDILSEEEPFILDNSTCYQLNNQLLNTLIEGDNSNNLFKKIRATGQLPCGVFGELYWYNQQQQIMELADKIKSEIKISEHLELNIKIGGVYINGCLTHIQNDGLLRWRPANLSIIDGILLWLEHLIYCYIGGTGISRLYGKKNTTWCFAALTQDHAKKYLSELIEGYQYGLSQPLILLHKSGWAWLKTCYHPKTQQIDWQHKVQLKAQDKLLQNWYGNQYMSGERDDPYIQRVLSHLKKIDLAQILLETERYLLPIARYNITRPYNLTSNYPIICAE